MLSFFPTPELNYLMNIAFRAVDIPLSSNFFLNAAVFKTFSKEQESQIKLSLALYGFK